MSRRRRWTQTIINCVEHAHAEDGQHQSQELRDAFDAHVVPDIERSLRGHETGALIDFRAERCGGSAQAAHLTEPARDRVQSAPSMKSEESATDVPRLHEVRCGDGRSEPQVGRGEASLVEGREDRLSHDVHRPRHPVDTEPQILPHLPVDRAEDRGARRQPRCGPVGKRPVTSVGPTSEPSPARQADGRNLCKPHRRQPFRDSRTTTPRHRLGGPPNACMRDGGMAWNWVSTEACHVCPYKSRSGHQVDEVGPERQGPDDHGDRQEWCRSSALRTGTAPRAAPGSSASRMPSEAVTGAPLLDSQANHPAPATPRLGGFRLGQSPSSGATTGRPPLPSRRR